MSFIELIDHLLQAGWVGVDYIVGQEHGERLVAHQFTGHEHRVSQAHGFLLPHIGDVDHVRDLPDNRQQVGLLPLLQHLLELVADVEVVFDCALTAAGDNDDLIAACGQSFLDSVLDDRLVDNGQHLFGLRFSGGQKPRTQTCSGEHRIAYSHCH